MMMFRRNARRWLTAVVLTGVGVAVQAAPMYTITDLSTFGGVESHGHGINDSGQVAGFFTPLVLVPAILMAMPFYGMRRAA
jgi:hypothetical protein